MDIIVGLLLRISSALSYFAGISLSPELLVDAIRSNNWELAPILGRIEQTSVFQNAFVLCVHAQPSNHTEKHNESIKETHSPCQLSLGKSLLRTILALNDIPCRSIIRDRN